MSEPQRLRAAVRNSKRIGAIIIMLSLLGAGLYGIATLVSRLPDLATITPYLRTILIIGLFATMLLAAFRRRIE
jgi:hypothetical protein